MDFTIKVFVYKTAYMFSSIQAISRPTHRRVCVKERMNMYFVYCCLLVWLRSPVCYPRGSVYLLFTWHMCAWTKARQTCEKKV